MRASSTRYVLASSTTDGKSIDLFVPPFFSQYPTERQKSGHGLSSAAYYRRKVNRSVPFGVSDAANNRRNFSAVTSRPGFRVKPSQGNLDSHILLVPRYTPFVQSLDKKQAKRQPLHPALNRYTRCFPEGLFPLQEFFRKPVPTPRAAFFGEELVRKAATTKGNNKHPARFYAVNKRTELSQPLRPVFRVQFTTDGTLTVIIGTLTVTCCHSAPKYKDRMYINTTSKRSVYFETQ